ncbi:MAG: site-2 protease family protein [Candidatus Krumholzibacteria bacterium]|nr:site-2 protease family protein [Candidatus Krumholzibacteria bacterium]MDH4337937.1 site-2 protease family protein [Candidatus Krumholzibacteria bacterium]MDH5270317.1 site-2 protease family protein [Candidatus Krumholzibacteria bacterium]
MRYTLGLVKLFGIPVRVHATFPLVLVLYAAEAGRSGSARDALLAALLVLLVFGCVVLHELGHSLMARRYGIRVRDIVLFPIGGVARAESIPEDPRQEIAVAIAGPIVNFAIAGVLFALLAARGVPPHGGGFFVDLAWVNLALGVFNLIPAFPMDGGRILRGMLSLRVPYLEATRRARGVGQLIALGFATLALVNTSFIMLALIAVFVFAGGMMEERAVSTRLRLGGRSVGDLTDASAPVFALDDAVGVVVDRADGRPAFAVAGESGSLAGVVSVADLLHAVRDGRAGDALSTIARSDFPVTEASTEASRVYRYLKEERKPFAAVVEGDRFLGLFHAD